MDDCGVLDGLRVHASIKFVAADEVEALVAQKTRAGRPLECCRRRSGILTLRPLSNTNSFVNLLPPEIAWTVSGTGRNSAPNVQTLQVGALIHSFEADFRPAVGDQQGRQTFSKVLYILT